MGGDYHVSTLCSAFHALRRSKGLNAERKRVFLFNGRINLTYMCICARSSLEPLVCVQPSMSCKEISALVLDRTGAKPRKAHNTCDVPVGDQDLCFIVLQFHVSRHNFAHPEILGCPNKKQSRGPPTRAPVASMSKFDILHTLCVLRLCCFFSPL
jgi:hypothetical protein